MTHLHSVLVPGIVAATLLGGVAAASAASTTTALSVCVRAGYGVVAPTASTCPKGYVLTRVVGARGLTGATGARGATGPTGLRGPTGATGLTGAAGATGPTGATGLQGPAGPAGAAGAAGPQGPAGAAGPAGSVGATGPAGQAGADGADGTDGADGLPGQAGADGQPGQDGATGPQGSAGAPGPQGERGAPGETGPAGADGVGPAYLDTGEATVYTATDTHTLAVVTLPAGTYTLAASVFVSAGATWTDDDTLTCTFVTGGGATLLTPQPPAVVESEAGLIGDIITLPWGAVTVSAPGPSTLSLRCAAVNTGQGLTLTGTLTALRVSSATVT
jgi:hypothetical protein